MKILKNATLLAMKSNYWDQHLVKLDFKAYAMHGLMIVPPKMPS